MKGYTDIESVENYLLTSIDSGFAAQVEDWIAAMEAYVDNITGRNFIADSVASQRVYDGDNTTSLIIDDCVQITSVQIGSEAALNKDESDVDDDYYIYPLNILPKTGIRLVNGYFPSWPPQTVKVTAKWGYSVEVPADIKHAVTLLVAGIINFGNQAEGEIQSMSIGRYNVTYKDNKQWEDFQKLDKVFEHYKKYTI